jgi:hypothetical protein
MSVASQPLSIAPLSVILGRLSTMTIAGAPVLLGASYAYPELIEIRGTVTGWTGIGSTFDTMFIRQDATVDSTGKTLRAIEAMCANADNMDVGVLQTFLFNTIGKGNSAIAMMRGGEIKLEWLATDVVTDARALIIEYQGLSVPTNPVYGIYFEKESASGAMAAKFYEIRMKSGMVILSGSGAPAMAAPQGSLYLRTDGSGVADRAYINTDGSTTWTAISTVA